MNLSDGWMMFAILAFTAYIVLDGYDLGIGVLTLLDRNTDRRREMRDLVSWLWDGNESWLVLLALILWAGEPRAFGVALPALYLPLCLMLFSLIGRGVSLELIGQHDGWHPVWGRVFGITSLVAAFCQGAAFGGLVAGLPVRGNEFAGNSFTFLHGGYSVLTGLTAVVLYAVAGSAYLYFKTDGETQKRATRTGRRAIATLTVGTVLCWLLAPVAGSLVLHPTSAARLPVWIVGAVVLTAGLGLTFMLFSPDARARRPDRALLLATLTIYAGGLLLAGGLVYPMLVPPHVTVHSAASPDASLLFLIVAAALVVPIVLCYQAYGYWVFRGKINATKKMQAA